MAVVIECCDFRRFRGRFAYRDSRTAGTLDVFVILNRRILIPHSTERFPNLDHSAADRLLAQAVPNTADWAAVADRLGRASA